MSDFIKFENNSDHETKQDTLSKETVIKNQRPIPKHSSNKFVESKHETKKTPYSRIIQSREKFKHAKDVALKKDPFKNWYYYKGGQAKKKQQYLENKKKEQKNYKQKYKKRKILFKRNLKLIKNKKNKWKTRYRFLYKQVSDEIRKLDAQERERTQMQYGYKKNNWGQNY